MGVLPNVQWRRFPSSPRRGVCAIKKKLRSILSRADGVVSKFQQNLLVVTHHPVRSIKDASRYFIDVAARPSSERRGKLLNSALCNSPKGRKQGVV